MPCLGMHCVETQSLVIIFSIFQQDIESSLREKKNSLKNSQMASNEKKWLFDKVHKKCDSASVLLMSFFLCYVSEKPINNMKVISLATGSKCLGKSQIENKKGRLLFSLDAHFNMKKVYNLCNNLCKNYACTPSSNGLFIIIL